MATDASKIISIIQPKYLENRIEVSQVLKKEGFSAALKVVKPHEPALWEHNLVYDSSSETLEPVYFWILDFMNDTGFETLKLVDNFVASPGGGYFAELGARASKMQEEGMKILGSVNAVLKSIINLLYDLKEFEIRLKQYDLTKSKEDKEKESGILGLKQVWMDKVDIQRGNSSIKAMAMAQPGFTTLIDAFMAAKSAEDVDKMDLNDRTKRILKPRIAEFLEWKERSEAELRKRFEIEKSYLKSQVGSLKLYTRWAKPYLKAAEELMMKGREQEPALVKAFNTVVLELCILGKSKINVEKEVDLRNLPQAFRDMKLKRNYYSCVLIDFVFRGIPSRTREGHFVFGGRVNVNFKAFALNEDELAAFKQELEKQDFADALKLVEVVTEESLAQITEDIEHFLEAKAEKEKKKKEKEKEIKISEIRKDSFEESVIRELAERNASVQCFSVYDKYKKAHAMASFAEPEWEFKPRWRIPL